MNLRNFLPAFFISSFLLTLIACGGGGGSDGTSTPASITFTLQCDLNTTYAPIAPPVTSAGSGVPNTTVIALHGKNGSPLAVHMTALAADLNTQGYNVVMPYMPWSGLNWNGTLCEGIAYINSLIDAENNAGNSVILLGHSLAGPIVLSYAALEDTTKPSAVTVLAPGHFVGNSSVLASLHASSIQTAKNMVAAGQGDVIATFQTGNGGVPIDISTTPNIYLSYHDTAQFPNIKATIPLVSEPTLWLAGLSDSLTDTAKRLGIIDTIPTNSNYDYREIQGDHFSMVSNSPDELVPWYKGL